MPWRNYEILPLNMRWQLGLPDVVKVIRVGRRHRREIVPVGIVSVGVVKYVGLVKFFAVSVNHTVA
jgi:hypothetical protein